MLGGVLFVLIVLFSFLVCVCFVLSEVSSYSDCCPLKEMLLLGFRCFIALVYVVYISVCRYNINFVKYYHS